MKTAGLKDVHFWVFEKHIDDSNRIKITRPVTHMFGKIGGPWNHFASGDPKSLQCQKWVFENQKSFQKNA